MVVTNVVFFSLGQKCGGGCISRRGGATYCYFWSILSIHLACGNHLLRLSGKSPLPTSVPGLQSCLGPSSWSSLAVWFRPASQCLTFLQALGIGSGWPIWAQLKHPSAIHRLQFTINFSPLCFYLGAFLSFFHCRPGACFQQLPSQGLPSMLHPSCWKTWTRISLDATSKQSGGKLCMVWVRLGCFRNKFYCLSSMGSFVCKTFCFRIGLLPHPQC